MQYYVYTLFFYFVELANIIRHQEWAYENTSVWGIGMQQVPFHVYTMCILVLGVYSSCFFKVFDALCYEDVSPTGQIDPAPQRESRR